MIYFLSKYHVYNCDDFILCTERITYRNDALNHTSFRDHVFVSDTLRQDILSAVIYDSGANRSDHAALVYSFNFDAKMLMAKPRERSHSSKPYSWRWDKADLGSYCITIKPVTVLGMLLCRILC